MSARLVLRNPDGSVRSFPLAAQSVIGTAASADVCVAGDRVSPVHARLTADGDGYWIEDSGGSGTNVNGARITRVKLRHFDVITIGSDVSLVFLTTTPGSARVVTAPDDQLPANVDTIAGKSPLSPGGMPKFAQTINEPLANLTPPVSPPPAPDAETSIEPPKKKSTISGLRLVGASGTFKATLGTCIVGRDALAGVRIDSKEVSRHHADLVIKPDGITVEDKDSANGTRVNGARISSATPLQNGDTVAFSGFKFTVEVLRLEH